MRFPSRVLTIMASVFLILMMIGCDARAGSTGASSPAGTAGAAGSGTSFEQTLVDEPANETIGEPAGESASEGSAGATASGASSDSGFGGGGGVDDPFAVIGPAFSGLGFQTYSSSCDPFEDAYGTCL